MPMPYKIFERRFEVKLTSRQLESIYSRSSLDGTSPSQVIRDALDAYLTTKAKKAS